MRTRVLAILTLWMALLFGIEPASAQTPLPKPDHIVIVIEENHSFAQIIDSPLAPYLNSLARKGALLTNSYGITHPSQPNYIALFAGSIEGVNGNTQPARRPHVDFGILHRDRVHSVCGKSVQGGSESPSRPAIGRGP